MAPRPPLPACPAWPPTRSPPARSTGALPSLPRVKCTSTSTSSARTSASRSPLARARAACFTRQGELASVESEPRPLRLDARSHARLGQLSQRGELAQRALGLLAQAQQLGSQQRCIRRSCTGSSTDSARQVAAPCALGVGPQQTQAGAVDPAHALGQQCAGRVAASLGAQPASLAQEHVAGGPVLAEARSAQNPRLAALQRPATLRRSCSRAPRAARAAARAAPRRAARRPAPASATARCRRARAGPCCAARRRRSGPPARCPPSARPAWAPADCPTRPAPWPARAPSWTAACPPGSPGAASNTRASCRSRPARDRPETSSHNRPDSPSERASAAARTAPVGLSGASSCVEQPGEVGRRERCQVDVRGALAAQLQRRAHSRSRHTASSRRAGLRPPRARPRAGRARPAHRATRWRRRRAAARARTASRPRWARSLRRRARCSCCKRIASRIRRERPAPRAPRTNTQPPSRSSPTSAASSVAWPTKGSVRARSARSLGRACESGACVLERSALELDAQLREAGQQQRQRGARIGRALRCDRARATGRAHAAAGPARTAASTPRSRTCQGDLRAGGAGWPVEAAGIAAQTVVQQGAQRVDVGRRCADAGEQLRCHVRGCAARHAGQRWRTREAEVDQRRALPVGPAQHVVGLDVAVHQRRPSCSAPSASATRTPTRAASSRRARASYGDVSARESGCPFDEVLDQQQRALWQGKRRGGRRAQPHQLAHARELGMLDLTQPRELPHQAPRLGGRHHLDRAARVRRRAVDHGEHPPAGTLAELARVLVSPEQRGHDRRRSLHNRPDKRPVPRQKFWPDRPPGGRLSVQCSQLATALGEVARAALLARAGSRRAPTDESTSARNSGPPVSRSMAGRSLTYS